MLRVSDAGRSRRCGLHRGRRPKPSNEGTRGKWQAVVPLNWIAVGDPAEILPPNDHERIWAIQRELDFPKYVFGIEGRQPIGKVMSEVMPRYARALQAHREDRLL